MPQFHRRERTATLPSNFKSSQLSHAIPLEDFFGNQRSRLRITRFVIINSWLILGSRRLFSCNILWSHGNENSTRENVRKWRQGRKVDPAIAADTAQFRRWGKSQPHTRLYRQQPAKSDSNSIMQAFGINYWPLQSMVFPLLKQQTLLRAFFDGNDALQRMFWSWNSV